MMSYEEMIALYEKFTAATMYNVGFVFRHTLYSIDMRELPVECLKLGRASSKRGGTQRIRVRISKAVKLNLIEMGAEVLGPDTMLESEDIRNRGLQYERIITERAGQTWAKDSVPFYVAGDLALNGEQIQIKLDGATLVEETTLYKLLAAA